ncbi:DUF1638 domain-containing protein [Anaeroselena agilis]|uniref:DUF1638 domain-containing protein n=1 Tax=Anaeroselena agilis TaxID=3063788 RepID=A0ABU3P0L0_9FIRM|nr:DUF1638 domain-containing protein [Selenomonadales bacterium 4137-cl]
MRAVIIACQTIKEELCLALKETGVDYPVIYIESGLHNTPNVLHSRIQAQLDLLGNVDYVLLAFGFCGNSLVGIKSSAFTIVLPKADDCIPLLLGSCEARKLITQEMGTYFATKGWLDYEKNILWEYERCISRYGEQRALRVMKTMLGHYRRFMVIDTGAYETDCVTPRTEEFAARLGLKHAITPGSLRLLHKLLLGQWDQEFIVLAPGEEISLEDVCSAGGGQVSQPGACLG